MSPHLSIARRGPVLEATLRRPEKLNAMTPEMLAGLRDAVGDFAEDAGLRVMLIRAEGKYFSAGVDLGGSPTDFRGSSRAVRDSLRSRVVPIGEAIERVEKPVVVAHQGPCLGGGLEISLSCDFRLAAASARYRLPEMEIGVIPASGGISRLTRVIGPHWARWLVMAGREIDAQKAETIGLVHQVFPDPEFDASVDAFCDSLAEKPPEATALAKIAIEAAADLGSADARRIEQLAGSVVFLGEERAEYYRRFQERQAAKRKPRTPPTGQ